MLKAEVLLPHTSLSVYSELPEDQQQRWEAFVSGPLAETNKKNTVDLVRPDLVFCSCPCFLQLPALPLFWSLEQTEYSPSSCPQVNTHHLHSSSDDEDDRLKEFNFPEEAVLQQVDLGLWRREELGGAASFQS